MKKFFALIVVLLFAVPTWGGQTFINRIKYPAAGGGGAGTVSYSSIGTIAHVEANTTISVTAPSNSSGDLLIALLIDDTDQAVSDWDGFTLITSQTQSSSRISMAYLTATGATSYGFDVSASTELTAVILRLTKDQGTWSIVDYDSAGLTSTTGDCTLPDVTVSQDNSMLIVGIGNDDDVNFANTPASGGGSMTQIGMYTTNDPRLGIYYSAEDTGTVSGIFTDVASFSDYTIIGAVIAAVE